MPGAHGVHVVAQSPENPASHRHVTPLRAAELECAGHALHDEAPVSFWNALSWHWAQVVAPELLVYVPTSYITQSARPSPRVPASINQPGAQAMPTRGASLFFPSHNRAPPPPDPAVFPVKLLARSFKKDALTYIAPPPSPFAVLATKREP